MKKPIIVGLCILALLSGLLCGCGPSGLGETQSSLNLVEPGSETQVTTVATQPPTTEPPTEPPLPDPEFPLAATHAFVYDCGKERVLFHKGGLEVTQIREKEDWRCVRAKRREL